MLKDIFIIFPEVMALLVALLLAILYLGVKNLKLKQKIYFANRGRDCYNQMLFAAKDGYFSFIYPDYNVKDPRFEIAEKCSRRLAVSLNLKNGLESSFEDVLSVFATQDAKELKSLLLSLKEEGKAFEKEFNTKKAKKFLVFGNKISDIKGNVFCDVLWFRDISFSNVKAGFLETSLEQVSNKNQMLENLLNTTPYPMWVRDEKLNVTYFNKAYNEICKNKEDILNLTPDVAAKNLPLKASVSQKSRKAVSSLVVDGKKHFFEFVETPISQELTAEINTCGIAIEATEVNDLKRKLKQNQAHQLEIFSTLGTAFMLFDETQTLSFYNDAFLKLFKIEKVWAESKPTYAKLLDMLREKRITAETLNYKTYKNDELLAFENLSSSIEDLVFLTDEKTLKRVRAPYSQGGIVFAFEDISNQISQQTEFKALVNIQKDILNNIFEAVVIFSDDNKLSFYNNAFADLWQLEDDFLDKKPTIMELINTHEPYFNKVENWEEFKKELLGHIFNPTTKTFDISRDEDTLEVLSKMLSDGSTIITYRHK